MANTGYGDDVSRFNATGSTGTQRRSAVTDLCDVEELLKIDSVGAEFARKGWNKYELPTSNHGTGVFDKGFPMPGGNAGANGHHNTADYPGGVT